MKHKNMVRLLSLVLVFFLFIGMIPGVSAYGTIHPWAKDELDRAQSLGLIPPVLDQKDDLRTDITRLEMAHLAVQFYETRNESEIQVTDQEPFTDTKELVVAKAHAAGLANGYNDGTFKPKRPLTRQEFFTFVQNLLLVSGFEPDSSQYNNLSGFKDAEMVSAWALDATKLMVGLNVVNGMGDVLFPQALTPCEQAIVMMMRAYDVLNGMSTEPGPTDPDPGPTDPEPGPTDPEPGPTDPDTTDPPAPEPPKNFEEKYPHMQNWAKKELRPMDDDGLIPSILIGRDMGSPITRREVCHVAVTAFDKMNPDFPESQQKSPFTDTDDPIIVKAALLNIVGGFDDRTFRPDEPITREQQAKIMANFLAAVGYPHLDDPSVDLTFYSDGTRIHNYAKAPMRLLARMGIMNGSDNYMMPTSHAQCQQSLAMFYRTFLYFKNWENTGKDAFSPRPEADKLVAYALQFKGGRYIYGGTSPSGFDCSGLVFYVYKNFKGDPDIGYNIGRTAYRQWFYHGAREVPMATMLPGDLIFFSKSNSPEDMFHVGLYIGNHQYLHAANSSRGIVVDSVDSRFLRDNALGAKRILPD